MMRKSLMTAACAVALSLSACTESSETYAVGVDDAWPKLTSAGMGAVPFAVPSGLLGADVRVAFEVIPTDRTAYWKFTRNGKELGRVNVAMEGDQTSSTVSYSYAQAELADEDMKAEQMIRQFSQSLIVEAVDAKFENRDRDQDMKNLADAQTAMTMSGQMMRDASKAMDEAVEKSKAREKESEARAAMNPHNATKPTTDLSKFN